MLKFFRGRKRSRNVLLLIFVGILTLSLVGLFGVVVSGGGAGLFRGTGGNDSPVAKVAGYEVTVRELKDALNGYSQQIAQGQGNPRPDPALTYSLTALRCGRYDSPKIISERARSPPGVDSDVQARIPDI